MKRFFQYTLLAAFAAIALMACEKVDDLPLYKSGQAPELAVSVTSIAPAAADSNNTVLIVSWTSPAYATDSSRVKYVIELDAVGSNFSNPSRKVVSGTLNASYIAKELNNMLLARGYPFNTPVDIEVRVLSSYANNNEQLASNKIALKITPYKIPPKVVLPASGKLFIVGGATDGGWGNPVPVPTQELARLDETTFAGIFHLKANNSYLILPENGLWDKKFGYVGSNNGNNPGGDDFKAEGGDLMSPGTDGWYLVKFDFQIGKFTVTEFTTQHGLPESLFIVGNATPGAWGNPVPLPSQQFNRLNAVEFEIPSLALTAGGEYLFLPTNGMWDRKFGAVDNTAAGIALGGPMKPEGQNMPAPATSGNYKITVNFATYSYKLVKL